MSKRKNRNTGLPLPASEQSPIICKAESTEEEELSKAHFFQPKVKSEFDVAIKLVNDGPVKEERDETLTKLTLGEILKKHKTVDSLNEEHYGIPASNDIFKAEEVTYLKIEDNENLDFKIFKSKFEEEVEIGKHSLDVEGSLKIEEDSEIDLALLETKDMPNQCTEQTTFKTDIEKVTQEETNETSFNNFTCEFVPDNTKKYEDVNHSKKMPFACDVCNKSFSLMGNLVSHKRTHTKERPFICDVCKKRFSLMGNLVSHKRTHTKERPFICDVCKKRFSLMGNLVSHKRTHTKERPFTCDVCNKSFAERGALVRHKRTHTKERPYTCDVCNKRCSQIGNLVSHKRTHKKERPFTCDVCNKSYSSKSYLKKHIGIHFKY